MVCKYDTFIPNPKLVFSPVVLFSLEIMLFLHSPSIPNPIALSPEFTQEISFVSEEKYIKGVNKKAVFSPNRKPIKCELYINLNSEGKEEYQIEN